MADLAAQFPMTAVAPAEYLAFGDYDELTLSFWHRIIDFGGHSANSSPRVFLRSPTSSARFLFPQVAQASWSDWSVSLTDEAGWIIDTGSWADLQENADFLGINVDVTSGFDVSGLDTVVLIGTTAASIPAPAAALLLMPGLAAFRWQARR